MGILESILKTFLDESIIVDKKKLSASAYRIRMKDDSIKTAEFVPGYFLRVGIGISKESVSMKDFVRSYSVWDIDKKEGTIDLAIATHSQGAGADWVSQRKAGDLLYFTWKKGNFLIDNHADSYLMIGDLSALSHLYMIRRNLSEDKQVKGILYSQDKNELYADIDGSTPFDFYELPQNPEKQIKALVNEIVPAMSGTKMVYIAGDSRICQVLNKHFRNDLRWETKQIKTKPFWNPEKKGLE